jgi:hypothetical protein
MSMSQSNGADRLSSSQRSDMQIVADLIAARKEQAAERFARVVAELEKERDARQRFEYEARWLLRHAKELPCHVETLTGDREDRELVVNGATPADPNAGPCDYVLADCPRLVSLLKDEWKGR